MFYSSDIAKLQKDISRFDIPIFVAEREAPGDPFRWICLNDAHEAATGLRSPQVVGMRPSDVLPQVQAETIEKHYADCVDLGDIINYRELINVNGTPTEWNTTLQPIQLPCGRQRVVGTAVPCEKTLQTVAIEDVDFFARTAMMQIGKIGTFLSMLERRGDLPADLCEGASVVTGLCRSVEHVLGDIRRAGTDGLQKRVQRIERMRTNSTPDPEAA